MSRWRPRFLSAPVGRRQTVRSSGLTLPPSVILRRCRSAARAEEGVSGGVRFHHGRKNLGGGHTMSCGRPPGRIRRFFFRLAARRQKRCGDLFLEEPPPDSFVREPRRPKPQAPGGSVALEIPRSGGSFRNCPCPPCSTTAAAPAQVPPRCRRSAARAEALVDGRLSRVWQPAAAQFLVGDGAIPAPRDPTHGPLGGPRDALGP